MLGIARFEASRTTGNFSRPILKQPARLLGIPQQLGANSGAQWKWSSQPQAANIGEDPAEMSKGEVNDRSNGERPEKRLAPE